MTAETVSHTVTGVVLAGGKSSRMGRDKATLEFDGETLQERAVAVLRECFAEVVVIRQDDVPGLGPIGGLLTALRHLRTEALFLVACDMPFLDAGLIRRMAGELAGYDAVAIPGEPLHAAYSARILPVVEQQIAAGDYAMHRLLSKLRVKVVEARPIVNINTPQELEAACKKSRNVS
jgi:molybdopterin-guanine dinucleotide biosynthesis protein A